MHPNTTRLTTVRSLMPLTSLQHSITSPVTNMEFAWFLWTWPQFCLYLIVWLMPFRWIYERKQLEAGYDNI